MNAASMRLHGAFRSLTAVMRSRACGACVPAAPDWMDPAALESVSLTLPDRVHTSAPRLTLGVRNGIGAGDLPRQVSLGGFELSTRVTRVSRARAQAAPEVLRQRIPVSRGTATCVMRDLLNTRRHYVLTCAHVMAPTASSAGTDTAQIGGPLGAVTGYLCEWQPGLGVDAYRTTIDAALIEVTADDARALRANPDMQPERWSDDIAQGDAVTLRRNSGPLSGTLQIFWSGWIDVALTTGAQDYFLDDGIGYSTEAPTLPGDSGGAVWSAGRELLGMHLAEIDGQPAGGANAVFGRLAPVLDWFKVAPYTRLDPDAMPAPTSVAIAPQPPAAPGGNVALQDAEIVAQTLWGEARGEGEAGMRGVASVIRNRLSRQYRGKKTLGAVCVDPFQFSCWNSGDANRRKLDDVLRSPDNAFRLAQDIAKELLGSTLADTTNRATHYFATSIRTRPSWARGKTPCARIGGHEFYNDID